MKIAKLIFMIFILLILFKNSSYSLTVYSTMHKNVYIIQEWKDLNKLAQKQIKIKKQEKKRKLLKWKLLE